MRIDGATSTTLSGAAARRRRRLSLAVLGLFGPTASSGKSAVAEAIARRDSRRARLGRLDAGLPRPADPDQPVSGARSSGSGSSTTRHRSPSTRCSPTTAIDAALAAGTGRRSSSAGQVCTSARRSAISTCRRRPSPARGRAGSASTTGRAPRPPTRSSPERDPAAAATVHPNDRRRVVRALELAETGHSLRRRPALDDGDAAPDARRRTRRPAGGAQPPHRGADAGDVRRGSGGGGAGGALPRPLSATARKIIGLHEVAELPSEEAIARARRPGRGSSPRTSGSGCGGSRASLACGPTGPRTRWRMRFSRWRAAGNEYLLVERAELGGPLTARARSRGGRRRRRDSRGRRRSTAPRPRS